MVGEAALDRLRRLVVLESPSGDEPRLRAVAGDLAAELAAVGADVDTLVAPGIGEHVIARFDGRENRADPVLVLAHLDTVHPAGSFDPVFVVEGGRARGPGTFDMKGGLACMVEAFAWFHRRAVAPRRPVTLLATCDEETGSASSRGLIEETARNAFVVLVPEPPLPDGGAKTSRKGVGVYHLGIRGRASHAGLEPEAGVNALVELAHQILAVTALADPAAGTTISVGEAGGGTASNVVPAEGWATVDVRFRSRVEGERVDSAIRGLRPRLQGAELSLEGGINRGPLERTQAIAALYSRARDLADRDGWHLGEGSSGGASDGSLTSALGIPTLDGIGPMGAGAHSSDEHVLVDDLPRRVRLYGRLLESL